MWNASAAWTNDPDVKGHVPIVTMYAVVMFKGHVSSYHEWTVKYSIHFKMFNYHLIVPWGSAFAEKKIVLFNCMAVNGCVIERWAWLS